MGVQKPDNKAKTTEKKTPENPAPTVAHTNEADKAAAEAKKAAKKPDGQPSRSWD